MGLLIGEFVTNAVKYAYPNGDGVIEVSAREIDGHHRVEVSDQGIGLPDGFDTDQPHTSLGFKAIAGMVRQLQGYLTVTSNNPMGAHFLLNLPIFPRIKWLPCFASASDDPSGTRRGVARNQWAVIPLIPRTCLKGKEVITIPGEVEPPKQITKAEREARKAFRQIDAVKAMTEHEIAQKAFSNNRERLRAERLARETAGPLATTTKAKRKTKKNV